MIPCLFITANVGSIFEDPDGLLKLWVAEFLQTVVRFQPKFLAIHCQEIGGKNYEKSMCYVDEFVRILLSSKELVDFENVRVFIDEDFKTSDKFTALGNLYFVHKNHEAHIWNYNDQTFVPVTGTEIHSGNIENVLIKDKMKFPQDFFPEFKWSRKGFMKTRWLFDGIAFDMVNIHLFHDESNFVSAADFPSPYTNNRRRALRYTLDLIKADIFNGLPLFIFGDFNFRLDTKGVISRLSNDAKPSKILSSNGNLAKLIYADPHSDRHLTIERKHFFFSQPDFFTDPHNISLLREHDKEPSQFEDLVTELKINFLPSYPFKEDIASSNSYMNTRCPSWCDRIFMSDYARRLIDQDTAKYDLMGLDVPMGDHKPVYLFFQLTSMPAERESVPQRSAESLHGDQVLNCLLNHRRIPVAADLADCIVCQSSHLRCPTLWPRMNNHGGMPCQRDDETALREFEHDSSHNRQHNDHVIDIRLTNKIPETNANEHSIPACQTAKLQSYMVSLPNAYENVPAKSTEEGDDRSKVTSRDCWKGFMPLSNRCKSISSDNHNTTYNSNLGKTNFMNHHIDHHDSIDLSDNDCDHAATPVRPSISVSRSFRNLKRYCLCSIV